MISKDINTPEVFNYKIALALIIAWILVYMCMIKGIASSGKVLLKLNIESLGGRIGLSGETQR